MVGRLGFGAMRITGPGVWGPPRDEGEAIALLRRAVDKGVTFIDTADSYGPEISEMLIAQALHPYPAGLVIASKGGFTRPGPGTWVIDSRPEQLRRVCAHRAHSDGDGVDLCAQLVDTAARLLAREPALR